MFRFAHTWGCSETAPGSLLGVTSGGVYEAPCWNKPGVLHAAPALLFFELTPCPPALPHSGFLNSVYPNQCWHQQCSGFATDFTQGSVLAELEWWACVVAELTPGQLPVRQVPYLLFDLSRPSPLNLCSYSHGTELCPLGSWQLGLQQPHNRSPGAL